VSAIFGLSREVVGYVRDALILLVIITGSTYVLWNPDKLDTFLNWLVGRP
jgi:hypothetical protein